MMSVNFVGKSEGTRHLEDPGVDVRMILKWILKWKVGMDWIDLATDRNR